MGPHRSLAPAVRGDVPLIQLKFADLLVGEHRRVPSLTSRADDLDVGRFEAIEPGQRVAVGRDGEDLIALTFGQELMLAPGPADSRPQKVIWAYGQP